MKFFDSQAPSSFTKKLVLSRPARRVLSRLRCNGHSLLLNSYLSKIDQMENSLCSTCGRLTQDTSHLLLHCLATDSLLARFLAILFLHMTTGPDFGELNDFWSSMVVHHDTSLGRGRVTTRTKKIQNTFSLLP